MNSRQAIELFYYIPIMMVTIKIIMKTIILIIMIMVIIMHGFKTVDLETY